jgi:hypothetical protein
MCSECSGQAQLYRLPGISLRAMCWADKLTDNGFAFLSTACGIVMRLGQSTEHTIESQAVGHHDRER